MFTRSSFHDLKEKEKLILVGLRVSHVRERYRTPIWVLIQTLLESIVIYQIVTQSDTLNETKILGTEVLGSLR